MQPKHEKTMWPFALNQEMDAKIGARKNKHVRNHFLYSKFKGDFYSLVQIYMKDLNIQCDETMIIKYSKSQWKNFVKNRNCP